jgi:hypothetical protein
MARPRPAAESALKERERDARDDVSMMENGAIEKQGLRLSQAGAGL